MRLMRKHEKAPDCCESVRWTYRCAAAHNKCTYPVLTEEKKQKRSLGGGRWALPLLLQCAEQCKRKLWCHRCARLYCFAIIPSHAVIALPSTQVRATRSCLSHYALLIDIAT